MTAALATPWLGWLALLALALCVTLLAHAALVLWASWLSARASAHMRDLDAQLRLLFLPARARAIVSAQALSAGLVVILSVWMRQPLLLPAIPLIAAAPRAVLEFLRKRRSGTLDAKLDGFALSLANATRATPSIGRALEMVQKTLPYPLDQEIELVLREMRVGSSVDQALLGMSARVRSTSLDAVLSGVLIGRQVGGNLPEILETTASTLREMARLEGVLRSKTAEAKAQTWVLAGFPLFLVVGFNAVSPGHFETLTNSGVGMLVAAVAVLCWVSSIVLARRILSVEL